jgi:hypothetical protein
MADETDITDVIEPSGSDDLAETELESPNGSAGLVETEFSAGAGEIEGQAEAAEQADAPILVADENTLLAQPDELPQSPVMAETNISSQRNTRDDPRSRNGSGKRSKPAKRHYE